MHTPLTRFGTVPLRVSAENAMITRVNWRERMESDMRLRDLRPRTIEGYLLAIRLFIERVDKEPRPSLEGRQAPSAVEYQYRDLRLTILLQLHPAA